MDKLEQCPFCGFDSPTMRIYKGKDGWRDRYTVICRYDEGGCGAEGGMYHTAAEAAAAWNNRATRNPKTNADMIRSMPDNELLEVIGTSCSRCTHNSICGSIHSDCISGNREWLKLDAANVDDHTDLYIGGGESS